jgi:membrane protein
LRGLIRRAIDDVVWYRGQLVAQFREHGLFNSAAALTYTTLFAVVPLMTVAFAIVSVLPDFEGFGERIENYVFQHFVPQSSTLIGERLKEFSEQARQLSVWGTALLVVTAFMMLLSVESAFNAIWKVTEPRRGLQRFLAYWGVLTCGPLLVVGGLLISSYLFSLPFVADIDTIGLREKALGYLPILLNTAAFTVLYSAVPSCHVPFLHALLGGLFSMAVLEAAKGAFAWYVAGSNIALIYGTFAAVPLFLAWIYLFWVLVLSGAILVRTLSLPRDPQGAHREPPLILCLRVLTLLHAGHRAGRSVTEQELGNGVPMRLTDRERVFDVLHAMDLVATSGDGSLTLRRDLRQVKLSDLYRRLPEGIDLPTLQSIQGLGRAKEPLEHFARVGDEALDHDLDGLLA